MKQQRFVLMLPVALKKRLRHYAVKKGVPMRTIMIRCLEQRLGRDWRDEEAETLPGTQRLLPEEEEES